LWKDFLRVLPQGIAQRGFAKRTIVRPRATPTAPLAEAGKRCTIADSSSAGRAIDTFLPVEGEDLLSTTLRATPTGLVRPILAVLPHIENKLSDGCQYHDERKGNDGKSHQGLEVHKMYPPLLNTLPYFKDLSNILQKGFAVKG
jgi:hypothetical protein